MKFIRPIIFMVLSLNIKSHASLIDQLPSMSPQEMQEKFTPVIQYLNNQNNIYQNKWEKLLDQRNFSEDALEKKYIEYYLSQRAKYSAAVSKYERQLPDRNIFDLQNFELSTLGIKRKEDLLGQLASSDDYQKQYKTMYNKISILTDLLEKKERKDMVKHLINVQEGYHLKFAAIEKLKNLERNYELHILNELQSILIPAYLKINNLEILTIKSVSAQNEKDIVINPLHLFVEGSTVQCLAKDSQNNIKHTLAEINSKQPSHPILKLLGYQHQTN